MVMMVMRSVDRRRIELEKTPSQIKVVGSSQSFGRWHGARGKGMGGGDLRHSLRIDVCSGAENTPH